VKSMRFFVRAIEVYDAGLAKYPQSLDLAYNKYVFFPKSLFHGEVSPCRIVVANILSRARVQLEIATHPLLVKQLQASVLSVLEEALASHRYALALDQDNADTLFNTSQVLTTIAEELAKDNSHSDQDALQPLEEALELQNRCLSIQELKHEQAQAQDDGALAQTEQHGPNEPTPAMYGGSNPPDSNMLAEQWFSVVEPVTEDTLIDTALAQLGTMTTLCSILSSPTVFAPASSLAWVEEYSSKILNVKLPMYTKNAGSRLREIAMVRANFVSALLEAGFRSNKVDAATYKRERDGAFDVPELNLENSYDSLLANAQSLVAFASALAEPVDSSTHSASRWNALSAGLASLVKASKIPGISTDDTAKTHLLRGDSSLAQYQMGQPPTAYPAAILNAAQLLKNAEVFYRNASKLASEDQEKAIAGLRSAIAAGLQKGDLGSTISSANSSRGQDWLREQVQDMISEGLLPDNLDKA